MSKKDTLNQFTRIKDIVEKEMPLWSEENKLVITSNILMKHLSKIDGMSDNDLIQIVRKEQKVMSKSIGNDFGADIQIDENRTKYSEEKDEIYNLCKEDSSEPHEARTGEESNFEISAERDNTIELIFKIIDKSNLNFIERESLRTFYDKGYDSFVLKNFTSIGKSRVFSEAYQKFGSVRKISSLQL